MISLRSHEKRCVMKFNFNGGEFMVVDPERTFQLFKVKIMSSARDVTFFRVIAHELRHGAAFGEVSLKGGNDTSVYDFFWVFMVL